MDDPWNWDVDRVVKELCTPDRSWFSRYPDSSMPDPKTFEEGIRQNEIDGFGMLHVLDVEAMKELGVNTLKQRQFLQYAISKLRSQSISYCERHGLKPLSNAGPLEVSSSDQKRSASERPEGAQTKKRKINPEDQEPIAQGSGEIPRDGLDREVSPAPQGSLEDILTEKPEKQRKRITPTLIGAIDPKRKPDSLSPVDSAVADAWRTADGIIIQDVATGQPESLNDTVMTQDATTFQPGSAFIDEAGKKRMILQPQVGQSIDTLDLHAVNVGDSGPSTTATLPHHKSQLVDDTEEILARGYLGKQKMLVDDIFYGKGLPGSESVDNETQAFQIHGLKISPGRRLYVHNVMKKYLCQHYSFRIPKKFFRNGKLYSAILPYSVRLVPEHRSQHFTLLYSSEDKGVHSSKQKVSEWPELGDVGGEAKRIVGAFSHVTTDYDALLEKYKNTTNDEEPLPTFGESGSDGEYDYDTWKEMEAEHRKLKRPILRSQRSPMSTEQVNSAINEAIAELTLKWKTEKLPKLASKEWSVYRSFRLAENRKHRKKILRKEILHFNDDRIPKQRKEIVEEVWTRPEQVRKQVVGSLEVTIFDRERMSWELEVLKRKTPPQKPVFDPLHVKLKRPTEDLADGEELIPSESECDTDDGMDGFIYDDSELGDVDAEIEDGDDESSDWSQAIEGNSKTEPRAVVAGIDSKTLPLENTLMSDPLSEDEEADVPVKHEEKPLHLPIGTLKTSTDMSSLIDLTLTSDSAAEGRSLEPTHREPFPHRKSDAVDLDTPQKEVGKKLIIKANGRKKGEVVIISSDSDSKTPSVPKLPSVEDLPPYSDSAKIAKLSWGTFERLGDRNRLIIAFLHKMKPKVLCERLLAEFRKDESTVWMLFIDVLHAMHYAHTSIQVMAPSVFDTYVSVVRLLRMYVDCKYRGVIQWKNNKWLGIDVWLVSELEAKTDDFHNLYELVVSFAKGPKSDENGDKDDESLLRGVSRKSLHERSATDDVFDIAPTPTRKRKIVENQEARELRESNKERIEQQRKRRLELQEKLASQGISTTSDSTHIIINEGKHEDEGFTYINETIGKRIKPHQIAGVRFMWEQIVTDSKNMQGCLLAHTMGLGKTMQVITLLVAIAEASKSEDESVVRQIPKKLRLSRTLVLCPSGLVDNWEDELLTWAPEDTLGHPLKVSTQTGTIYKRLEVIKEWYESGGVLILGYDMFRTLLVNTSTKRKSAPLTEEDLQTLKDQLLDGPNIIIADEAHKLKNSKSKISVLTSQFTSKSRIALTGSPLNNNVEEYHTMIEWVAPNYLGPIAEFRSKYKEPIEAGLWIDSSLIERKMSKKMLAVLIQDLELKVNRANMGVLRDDLPPKKEFVIRLALTKLQEAAYVLYVRNIRDDRALDSVPRTKDGYISQSALWSWLSVLSLLCNHPSCFKNKIEELTKQKSITSPPQLVDKNARTLVHTSDDEEDRGEENKVSSLLGTAILQADATNSILGLFGSVENIMDPVLSNKSLIVSKILDACRAVGDKVLIFSQSIPTLDFVEYLCKKENRSYQRLDGKTAISIRQAMTKEFNAGSIDIMLVSTQAGGLGLNLFAANRVIIFDFKYNPTQEEQAIGRAYRIGQAKPVFVYRFVMSGTFEEKIENKAVYKMQLASRVVDKENPIAWAKKRAAEYLVDPQEVEQQDLTQFYGEDKAVLDKILYDSPSASTIRSILKTDTFAKVDDEDLTVEDQKEVEQMRKEVQLKRQNPAEYDKMIKKRAADQVAKDVADVVAFKEQQVTNNNGIMGLVKSNIDVEVHARSLAVRTARMFSAGDALSQSVPTQRNTYHAQVPGQSQDQRMSIAKGNSGNQHLDTHQGLVGAVNALNIVSHFQQHNKPQLNPILAGHTTTTRTLEQLNLPSPSHEERALPNPQRENQVQENLSLQRPRITRQDSLFSKLPAPTKGLRDVSPPSAPAVHNEVQPNKPIPTPLKHQTPNHRDSKSKGSIFGPTNSPLSASTSKGRPIEEAFKTDARFGLPPESHSGSHGMTKGKDCLAGSNRTDTALVATQDATGAPAISSMDGTFYEGNSKQLHTSRNPLPPYLSTSPRNGALPKPTSPSPNNIIKPTDPTRSPPATSAPSPDNPSRLPPWAKTGIQEANTPGAGKRPYSRAPSRASSITPSSSRR